VTTRSLSARRRLPNIPVVIFVTIEVLLEIIKRR